MNSKVIDDIPQVTQCSAPESMMEWFDNRAEELFSDEGLGMGCLVKHSRGDEVASARGAGDAHVDQLIYDCCCIAAWEEACLKWLDGEF